jgi:hypothetical protein
MTAGVLLIAVLTVGSSAGQFGFGGDEGPQRASAQEQSAAPGGNALSVSGSDDDDWEEYEDDDDHDEHEDDHDEHEGHDDDDDEHEEDD